MLVIINTSISSIIYNMLFRRTFEEIIQICFVLFIISMFATFVMSNIFSLIDRELMKIENINLQRTAVTLVLFIQLVVTAIIYLYIESFLYKIKTIRSLLGSTKARDRISLGESTTTEYCIHIVLLLFLIKMNSSLAFEMYYVSDYLLLVDMNKHITKH